MKRTKKLKKFDFGGGEGGGEDCGPIQKDESYTTRIRLKERIGKKIKFDQNKHGQNNVQHFVRMLTFVVVLQV